MKAVASEAKLLVQEAAGALKESARGASTRLQHDTARASQAVEHAEESTARAVPSARETDQKLLGDVAPPTRFVHDPQTLRGLNREAVVKLVPPGWVPAPLKKGAGIKFSDPKHQGDAIFIEDGWPEHRDPIHRGPYVKISINGKIDRIPLDGNPVITGAAD
jgi:hypothetical protein